MKWKDKVLQMFWRKKDLKKKLLIEVTGLFLLVAGFLSIYNYHRYTIAIQNFSETYIEEYGEDLIDSVIYRCKQPVISTADFLKQWLSFYKTNLQPNSSLSNFTMEKIAKDESFSNDDFLSNHPLFNAIMVRNSILMILFDVHDYLTSFSISEPSGNAITFYRPSVKNSGPISSGDKHKQVIDHRIHITQQQGTNFKQTCYFFDKNNNVVNKLVESLIVNHPYRQSWFKTILQDKKNYLTDISIPTVISEQTSPKAYLQFVTTLLNKDQGVELVINVDMNQEYLSSVLKKKILTDDSSVYILDEQNNLIASSDQSLMDLYKQNKIANLSVVALFNESNLWKALQKYNKLKKDHFEFDIDDEAYIAHMHYFNDDFVAQTKRKWKILSLTPTRTLFKNFTQLNDDNIILYLFILILILLEIVIIARRICDPITEITEEARRLRHLDFSGNLQVTSSIEEISILIQALQSMKSGLVSYQKYLPKDLVRRLIEKKQEIQLGGETKRLTVLFSDIAGFTSVSEYMSPHDLVGHLSDYFDHLTKIILREKGTIDKYIGDAIMAFWGAPESDDRMSYHACTAALRCQHALEVLNSQWHDQELPQLFTRFGIHHGDLIVGNIGSSERMNYTVIGDTVNIASRLEGVNKFYATRIIISHEVYEHVKKDFLCRPLDIVAVVGKTQGVKIYELMGSLHGEEDLLATPQQIAFCELFTVMMDFYLNMNFKKALEMIVKMKIYQKDYGHTLELYTRRCQSLLANPPQGEWSSVFHFDHK